MKPDERLLELIGNIPEEMLDEAFNVKRICRYRKKRAFYVSVAAACMVVLFLRFVPAGQVMAAQLKEHVERLLEDLFPPKDISLTVEGMEENVPHEVYGELPREAEAFPKETEEVSGENEDQAGFVIYVDMDSYEVTQEADCHMIRDKRIIYTRQAAIRDNAMLLADLSEEEKEQKIQEIVEERQAFYDNFPAGEIRITQKQEISVEDAAGEMKEELSGHYANVSDITVSALPKGLYLRADEGTAWDSEVMEVYFADNGLGGVFVITASYILEAEEGTGVRFHSMIETFRVLEPSEPIQILPSKEAASDNASNPEETLSEDGQQIKSIAENFVAAYFSGDTDTLQSYLINPYECEMEVYEGLDTAGAGTISELTLKGLTDAGKEEIGSIQVVSLEFRDSNYEGMFIYLTIEFVKWEDGWKIQFYGLEG